MGTDRKIWQLSELQRLLEGQIELARQGKLGEVETLGEQAGDIAKEIGQTGILEQAGFEEQREHLAGLYRDLRLTLSDQKDEISRELSRIRRGRRTIGAYRSNISRKAR